MEQRLVYITTHQKDYYKSGEYDENLFKETIEVLRSKGATVVEDINIPSFHREWSWGVSFMN